MYQRTGGCAINAYGKWGACRPGKFSDINHHQHHHHHHHHHRCCLSAASGFRRSRSVPNDDNVDVRTLSRRFASAGQSALRTEFLEHRRVSFNLQTKLCATTSFPGSSHARAPRCPPTTRLLHMETPEKAYSSTRSSQGSCLLASTLSHIVL